jgi:hypothetical protein
MPPIVAAPPGDHDGAMATKDPVPHPAFRTGRWLPRGHLAWRSRSRGPLLGGVWLRWRVWCRTRSLDEALARGVDPLRSDALSLRTGQLRSEKNRAQMVRSLLAALDLAGRQLPPASALRPLIRRREVLGCSELITKLAALIGEEWDPNVRGLAITSQLLRDGGGPLYHEHPRRPLDARLRSAIAALGDPSAATDASPRTERPGPR